MLKGSAEAAVASVRAAMGCKSDKARLLLEEQQMQQRLMAAQQQSDLKQQQMQQRLKSMQQQINREQLKQEQEAAVTRAHLEAMSDGRSVLGRI